MDNEIITTENIRAKIYEIRGQKVMLDRDLAALYGVETKALNQAVKRNIERFPSDFMFQLTKEESLRSQIVTLKMEQGKHLKYMPYAFTELGVAMLSSVLRSPLAISININIMRAFVEMRKYMALRSEESLQIENLRLELQSQRNYIEDILRDQNDINEETAAQLELINETLAEMQVSERNKAPRKKIGFLQE